MNVAELRTRFDLIPRSKHLRTPWENTCERLRADIREKDPNTFLTWPTVVATMFAGGSYIEQELQSMQGDVNWPKWLQAMQAPSFGGRPSDSYSAYQANSNTVHQTFHLYLWELYTRFSIAKLGRVVEWGGGYGAMAIVLSNLGFSGEYNIVDFPEFLALQEYYLSHTHPAIESVNFGGVFQEPVDLFIANFSLSETPFEDRLIPEAASYLISYQAVFDGMDNVAWFDKYQDDHPEVVWYHFDHPYLDTCFYLLGMTK